MSKLVPAHLKMTLDELRTLPEDALHAHHDAVVLVFKDDVEYRELIEEALYSYHYCDVCGTHYPIDDPCGLH